jgi:hypothetical protein
MLVFPLGAVLAANEVIINHSDYFSETIITPEQLEVSIEGLPDNDKILVEMGARKLISNTPCSIKQIDNVTALLSTQLE